MKVFTEILEIRQFSRQIKRKGKSIGFVATMGALHQGHLSLIKESLAQNDITICSIFVNPAQFNNPDDLKKYPRDLDSDLSKLETSGCDAVFHPTAEIIYPSEPITKLSFGYLEEIMEGKFRPGHFKGVGLVVSKLFNIIEPDVAYFGQKDLQQLTLIRTIAEELNFGLEIVPVKTMRDHDGLAMSSRNMLLSLKERKQATDLYTALVKAKNKLNAGESVSSVKESIVDSFKNDSAIELEYFEIVRTDDLIDIVEVEPGANISLCIAGYLGKVRLIDNISLN